MRTEVLVVGGGPSGARAAQLLAKRHEVLLAEEHRNPGEPLQCAGLVTRRGIPSFAEGSILGEVRGARLHSPLGFTLTLESSSSRACVIDRQHFDRLMFHRAAEAGASVAVGSPVLSLTDRGKAVEFELRSDKKTRSGSAEVVIGADGYKSLCRRTARLPAPKQMLTGIQADLKGVELDPDFVELYFGSSVAPGFFAWAIPAGDRVRVGLCTWNAELPPAVYLRRLLSKPEFAKAQKVSLVSGKIPVGPPRRAFRGKIVLVGDAASHAKPLSGGGVYTGVRGAELCADTCSRFLDGRGKLDEYDAAWWEEFGKELSRAFRIRRIFLQLTDKKLDKALRIFAEPEVKALLESRGDIDYPASLSSAVLKLAPKLAQFSPQMIKALL